MTPTRAKFCRVWSNMQTRLKAKTHSGYKNYGARGIRCLWNNFREFSKDMYPSYLEHLNQFGMSQTTLDRIDVDGHYCKENCRWVTWHVQQKNKRPRKLVITKALARQFRATYQKVQSYRKVGQMFGHSLNCAYKVINKQHPYEQL